MIDLLHDLIKVAAEVATSISDMALTFVDNTKSLDVVLDNIKKEKEEKEEKKNVVVPESEEKASMPECVDLEGADSIEDDTFWRFGLEEQDDCEWTVPVDCESDKEITRVELKEFLINCLWSLPQLLLHYGITQKDINEVISPFDQALNKSTNRGFVDAATLQLIYNNLQENYPLSELVQMGIYTHDGLLKINPVDVLYSKKEKSYAELAELELLNESSKCFEDIINDNMTDDSVKDVDSYLVAMLASNPNITTYEREYIRKILKTLPLKSQEEIKKILETKKATL